MWGTFQSNISLNYALNLVWIIYVGLLKKNPRFLVVFFGATMSGIVNSGQYCFFNALIQSLSNVYNIHRLLREHVHCLEEGEGKSFRFYINILGK